MNRGEMRENTRLLLGETVQDVYKDSEIDAQLNYGQLKVASDLLFNITYENTPTVTGQQRYGLPNDFLALVDIQLNVGGELVSGDIVGGQMYALIPLSYDRFQAGNVTASTGRPTNYRVEFGATSMSNPSPGDIWLKPIPDSDDYIVRLVHRQKPDRKSVV